jgi:hypothetical protein
LAERIAERRARAPSLELELEVKRPAAMVERCRVAMKVLSREGNHLVDLRQA